MAMSNVPQQRSSGRIYLILFSPGQTRVYTPIYYVGQKPHSGFWVTLYRKIQTNVLATSTVWGQWVNLFKPESLLSLTNQSIHPWSHSFTLLFCMCICSNYWFFTTVLVRGQIALEGNSMDVAICSDTVVSDSLQPHGRRPARPLCSWDSPVKDTGVGCHFLLQGIFLIQGLNTRIFHLLHWNIDSLPLTPKLLGWMTLFPDQQDWKNTGNLKWKGRSNAKKGKGETRRWKRV